MECSQADLVGPLGTQAIIKDNGSAFPVLETSAEFCVDRGLSVRDYFAAKAMQTLIGNPFYFERGFQALSFEAYRVADAMLSERFKQ